MKNINIKDFLLIFLILFSVDFTFIKYVLGPLFSVQIKNIQGSVMTVKTLPAAFAWFVTVAVLYYFIIRENKSEWEAAILGFLVYGVYEGTSYAIIKNWTFNTFIIDILWGTTLFFVSTKLFYNSTDTKQHPHPNHQMEREKWEVENNPDGEVHEMVHIYMNKGINQEDAFTVAKILSKYEDFWIEHMMLTEIGIIPELSTPWESMVRFFSENQIIHKSMNR